MAIAHVCLQCGWDLAWVRPQREPHYGLPLIRCPSCRAPAVRRVHPVKARWRQLVRFHWQTNILGFQFALIALFTFVTVMTAVGWLFMVAEWQRLHHPPRPTAWMTVWTFAILAPLTGAWLTTAFSHISRWRVWLGWLGWIALILMIVSIHGPIDREIDHRPTLRGVAGDPALVPWFFDGLQAVVIPGMLLAMLMMTTALAGMPLGFGVLRLGRAIRRAAWRGRRRRRRLSAAAAT